jgi:hypothetical protein
MSFIQLTNVLVEKLVLIGLLVSVIGSGYIFVVSIFLQQTSFAGFFNTWHFPMLLAIFIDIAFYKHINRMKVL